MKYWIYVLMFVGVGLASCASDNEPPTEDPVVDVKDTDTAFIKTVTFDSEDGLEMTADQYHIKLDKPVIILCHQAGWSRGE
jgi:hypothetical protein